ncbi:DUF5050 domain-containing protein [Microtetraspora sp. AC03309]|uniref:DUF5050 domain-containing protein n=1 Tax=Microtetraspora sp. AC03309 TaxID=2779376 RepID=UPI001E3CF2DD|nr:DUF5050 domain-containing protein [Microtetraspora sp. AC03309]MCC5580867.1 DUF5050 domain-containing protein [Microtetraspora sp. AC03309]
MFQEQIGGNKTAAQPFVTADGWVWFIATQRNELWRVRADGTQLSQPGGNFANSTPFVTPDGWVWFQGTNNRLYKMRTDGSQKQTFSNYTIASSPVVTADGWVWFQGTGASQLWRMRTDGSQLSQPGNNLTSSPPFVTADGWVWFRATNNGLWRMRSDGSELSRPGNNSTNSTPFVTADGWVWFQATNNSLWRMRADGSQLSRPGNNSCLGSPTVTVDGWVWFRATNNSLWRMLSDGSQLTSVDGNSTLCTPVVPAMGFANGVVGEWVYFQGTGNQLLRDFVPASDLKTEEGTPAYYVLTVAYAPPGTEGGGSSSSVQYAGGSSTGTTTTTSESFKNGTKVEASGGDKATLGGDFSASRSETNTSALEITKSQTYTLEMSGPAKDGINHDYDAFLLLLNPTVTAQQYPQDIVLWSMGTETATAMIYLVYAGWLKGTTPMPPGIKASLDARGLTQHDYDQILSTDPFARGSGAIDPERFLPTLQSFPYSPPLDPQSEPAKFTVALSSANVQTDTHEVQTEYTVGMSKGISFLKKSNELTWTSTSSEEKSEAHSQSATATVGGPAYGYQGPATVLVYWDTLYRSFMFAFPTTSASHVGTLSDESGQPLAYEPVTLTVGGHQFSTFTDGLGEYRFYGTPAGQGTITSGARQIQVELGG